MAGTGKLTAGVSWPLLLISFSILQMSVTGSSQSTPTLRFEVSVIIPCTYNCTCTCPLGTSGNFNVVRSNASALADAMELIAVYLKGNYSTNVSCAEVAQAVNATVQQKCAIPCPVDPTTSISASTSISISQSASSSPPIGTTSNIVTSSEVATSLFLDVSPSSPSITSTFSRSMALISDAAMSSSPDIVPTTTSNVVMGSSSEVALSPSSSPSIASTSSPSIAPMSAVAMSPSSVIVPSTTSNVVSPSSSAPPSTSDSVVLVSSFISSIGSSFFANPTIVDTLSLSPLPSPSQSGIAVSPSSSASEHPESTPSFTSTASFTAQPSPTPFTVSPRFSQDINDTLTGPTVNISNVNAIFSALLNDVLGAETIERGEAQDIIGSVADVADRILALNTQEVDREETSALGSSLVQLVDAVALSLPLLPGENVTIDLGNITVIAAEIEVAEMLESPLEHVFGDSFISLPRDVFRTVNADYAYEEVRVATVQYRRFSSLLPHQESSMRALDPIISSTLRNRTVTGLSTGVSIQVAHEPISSTRTCAFWNFTISNWDPSGCELLNFTSTSSLCRCNHLTHFAIILDISGSGGRLGVSPIHLRVLEILSYIGGGISVAFLILTICIFLALRSLWGLRTYIHIHLCSNLLISQVILLLGSGTERPFMQTEMGVNGTTIPTIGCTAVAVILQYFYSVTFMWMLMEGVILYIKLVKVFGNEDRKHYIIFTTVSYVLPLVYLILVVPLGLARPGHNTQGTWSYGALSACFLTTSDYFILAFAIPVILIILINCIFLVMVLVIISKKLRQSAEMSYLKKIRTWVRSTASLVIIMGIAWLIGLFTFHAVVYYIATLFYALQGVFIFLLFVVFAQQVRKEIKTRFQKLQASYSSSSAMNGSDQKSTTLLSILNFIRNSGADRRSEGKHSASKSSSGNDPWTRNNKAGGKTNIGIELGKFETNSVLEGKVSSVPEANESTAELVRGSSSLGDSTIKMEHTMNSPVEGHDTNAEVSVDTDECTVKFETT